MTIQYKDIKAESIDAAVATANRWIADEHIAVINVETIIDTRASMAITPDAQVGIRVWYQDAARKIAF